MSKHTPGPWVPVSDTQVDGFTRVRVAAENGRAGLVAICSGCRTSVDEDEANAGLIAAAPQLADALEELLVYVPGQIGDPARAALRKAGRLP